jgi:molecular chaperone GrpE
MEEQTHEKTKGKEQKEKPKKKLSELELKEQKIGELTETLQRLQAEFENYTKRNSAEKSVCIKQASKHIITKLLPILDNFELALKNTENKDEFVKGIEMIFAQIYGALEAEGLKKIDAVDKPFDPYFHEALMQDDKEDIDDNIITEEFQKGYLLNDEVIRPSKVKVNKKQGVDEK